MTSSAPTIERRRFARPPRRQARRAAAPVGHCREVSGGTLEDVVLAALAEIESAGRTTCPVCASPALERSGCTACGSHIF